MNEKWMWIKGFEGRYAVSDQGCFRTWMETGASRFLRDEPLVLKLRKNKTSGYLYLSPYNDKLHKTTPLKAHKVVMETFVGERPTNMDICHLNGNKEDNRLCNLMYGTREENCSHMLKHGTRPMGETHGKTKLTNEDVRNIKARLVFGTKNGDIARMYGVSTQVISNIKIGVTWRHI